MNTTKFNYYLNILIKRVQKLPKTHLIYGFFIFFASLIIIELFVFTVVNHKYYKSLADKQHISQVKLSSNR